MYFKKGQLVIKTLIGGGCPPTSVITKISSVNATEVKVENSEHLKWDAISGQEIDPVIPGFTSRLSVFDGGEIERWNLVEQSKRLKKSKR